MAPWPRLEPPSDAGPATSEFLNEQADVRRFVELHDLSVTKREDVHPSKIDEPSGSLRPFPARSEDDDLVATREKVRGTEILNVEGTQQSPEELSDCSNAPSQAGGRQVRRPRRTPRHLRIQESKNAFDISAPERGVNAASHIDVLLFARRTS